MSWSDRFAYWLRQINRRRVKGDLDEEIQLHLEMEIEAGIEDGLTPTEARRRALRRFGNLDRHKEESYDASGMARLDGWLRDISYAFRILRKRPSFTLLVAGILALGIGSSTAVFSVVHGVLLQPLPFRESSRLVTISAANDGRGWDGFPIPKGAFDEFRRRSRTLSKIAAFEPGAYTWVGGPEPMRLRGVATTPDFFEVMGVAPLLGRFFGAQDDGVILSHQLWRSHFGGDRSILGASMRLDGEVRTIVGVMPPGFSYPDRETQVWLPLTQKGPFDLWGSWSLLVVARLAPGASFESARQEISTLTEGFAEQLPFGGGWRFPLARLQDELLGKVRVGLWILFGSVGLLMLIAAFNVAAICLARTRDRGAELSMRSILGAGRWVLTRQLLVEHLLLALLGAMVGVPLAHGLLQAILVLSPSDLPRLQEVSLNGPALLFALVVTLFSGLIAAGLPVLSFRRLQSSPSLVTGARRPITAGGGPRSRRVLVAAQVSAVTILLVVAGLMVRSFLHVVEIDFGMRARNVLAVSVELARDRYPDSHQWSTFFDAFLQRVGEIPGVQSVGATTGLPTRGVQSIDSSFRTEAQSEPTPRETAADSVSPDFFRAAGVPILRGRAFQVTDRADSTLVAILNQKLAEEAFPGLDPVGKRILASDDETWLTVVGVSGNVKQFGLDRRTPLQVYRPLSQRPTSKAHLLIAVERERPELVDFVKQALHGIDPEQPLRSIQWMEALLSESVAPRRFPALLLGGFAVLSLLLALAGIYGMLAHIVSLRTHEMGVRLAVGAQKADLFRLILVPALRLTLAGLAVGLLAAVVVSRYMESQLFGVQPLDLTSFATVIVLVPLAGLLAGYLPARRAAATDPARVLRQD